MRSVFLLLLLACAGPAAHEHPASGTALDPATLPSLRVAVATTLSATDALAASDCALPTAPFVTCQPAEPDPVEPAPSEHHHHEAPKAPVAPPPHQHDEAAPVGASPPPAAPKAVAKPTAVTKVKDPICGMMIDPAKAPERVTRGGVTTFFCSATCKRAFLARATDGGTR
ncbi:MAG: YHS domain-containing protein [Myxococcales bacterium]|nr:YHS domain-containing protein [Myxococcales bacterium]